MERDSNWWQEGRRGLAGLQKLALTELSPGRCGGEGWWTTLKTSTEEDSGAGMIVVRSSRGMSSIGFSWRRFQMGWLEATGKAALRWRG